MTGWCYLVTTVTWQRSAWFSDPEVAAAVADLHRDAALFADSGLLAWVLMPDHWHGVIKIGEHSSLSRIMNRFKTRTALAAKKMKPIQGPVWSRGFHDRGPRNDRELESAIRYVIANPIRAGLCEEARMYPFGNASGSSEARRL